MVARLERKQTRGQVSIYRVLGVPMLSMLENFFVILEAQMYPYVTEGNEVQLNAMPDSCWTLVFKTGKQAAA